MSKQNSNVNQTKQKSNDLNTDNVNQHQFYSNNFSNWRESKVYYDTDSADDAEKCFNNFQTFDKSPKTQQNFYETRKPETRQNSQNNQHFNANETFDFPNKFQSNQNKKDYFTKFHQNFKSEPQMFNYAQNNSNFNPNETFTFPNDFQTNQFPRENFTKFQPNFKSEPRMFNYPQNNLNFDMNEFIYPNEPEINRNPRTNSSHFQQNFNENRNPEPGMFNYTQNNPNFNVNPNTQNIMNETFTISNEPQFTPNMRANFSNFQNPQTNRNQFSFTNNLRNVPYFNDQFNPNMSTLFLNNQPMLNMPAEPTNSFLKRLQLIPEFDGENFRSLKNFLEKFKTAHESCRTNAEFNELLEQVLLKVNGETKDLIVSLDNFEWPNIEKTLMNYYSHLCNKNLVNTQIETFTQEPDESLIKYTEKARKLLRDKKAMYSFLNEEQKSDFDRMMAKAFVTGSRDYSLRQRVLTRGADTLEKAIETRLI